MVNLLLFQRASSWCSYPTLSLKVGFRVLMTPTNHKYSRGAVVRTADRSWLQLQLAGSILLAMPSNKDRDGMAGRPLIWQKARAIG
jgi:hypothetical protein